VRLKVSVVQDMGQAAQILRDLDLDLCFRGDIRIIGCAQKTPAEACLAWLAGVTRTCLVGAGSGVAVGVAPQAARTRTGQTAEIVRKLPAWTLVTRHREILLVSLGLDCETRLGPCARTFVTDIE